MEGLSEKAAKALTEIAAKLKAEYAGEDPLDTAADELDEEELEADSIAAGDDTDALAEPFAPRLAETPAEEDEGKPDGDLTFEPDPNYAESAEHEEPVPVGADGAVELLTSLDDMQDRGCVAGAKFSGYFDGENFVATLADGGEVVLMPGEFKSIARAQVAS